jgi:hypothetical protein
MIKVIDTPRLNRNALIANVASVGGLLLLLASVAVPMFVASLAPYSLVTMVIGMGAAMVGIYFANRWVRKPRPEEQIDAALKGLGDTYVICHYPHLPIDHILLTPYGILIIETIAYAGLFTYRDGKWKEGMTIGRAIRYIVEEHLGNPTSMAASEIDLLKSKLDKEGLFSVPVKAVVLFSHPGAQLDVKNPSLPVCRIDKLKKQTEMTGAKLTPDVFEQVKEFLKKHTV